MNEAIMYSLVWGEMHPVIKKANIYKIKVKTAIKFKPLNEG